MSDSSHHYIREGSRFYIADVKSLDIHPKLPNSTFIVQFDQKRGQFYLEETDSFELPKKLYGNTTKHLERIYNTFKSRDKSTGVLLSGEKGSGKTLLAKALSVHGATADGIPTIIINQPWCGDLFNQFIQSIEHLAVILFDEFEKIYDAKQQEAILTLLDGVFPTKKLFVLTSNDKYKLNEHMRNRPGRLFYLIDFDGLDAEFVREYCLDNLNNKEHIDIIVKISALFSAFNFDLLQSIVEEANRYNENPLESLKLLNAKPNTDNYTQYDVKLFRNGQEIPMNMIHDRAISGNPTARTHGVGYTISMEEAIAIAKANPNTKLDENGEPEDEVEDYQVVTFGDENLHKIDPTNGVFVYHVGNVHVHLKKRKATGYDFKRYEAF